MAKIEEGKRREKILESELAKVFGDNWIVSMFSGTVVLPHLIVSGTPQFGWSTQPQRWPRRTDLSDTSFSRSTFC